MISVNQSIHDEVVSRTRESLHYLDVSIFNHILSGSCKRGMSEIYFDNGATTRALPQVREITDEVLEKEYIESFFYT